MAFINFKLGYVYVLIVFSLQLRTWINSFSQANLCGYICLSRFHVEVLWINFCTNNRPSPAQLVHFLIHNPFSQFEYWIVSSNKNSQDMPKCVKVYEKCYDILENSIVLVLLLRNFVLSPSPLVCLNWFNYYILVQKTTVLKLLGFSGYHINSQSFYITLATSLLYMNSRLSNVF